MAANGHNRAEAIYQKEAHIDGIFIIIIVRKRMSFRLCPKFCDRFFP